MAPELYGIGETGIYLDAEDLDAAEDWYHDVLGVETAFGDDHYRFLDLGTGSKARQHVILFDPDHTRKQETPAPHGVDGATHLALDVPLHDLPDWRRRLDAHNVPVTYERDWPDGARSLYFSDPAGNSLELMGLRTDELPDAWNTPPLDLSTALADARETIPDTYHEEWDALASYCDDLFADHGGADAISPANAYTTATVKIGAYLSGTDLTYADAAAVQGVEKDPAQLPHYAAELKDAMGLDERLQGDPQR